MTGHIIGQYAIPVAGIFTEFCFVRGGFQRNIYKKATSISDLRWCHVSPVCVMQEQLKD